MTPLQAEYRRRCREDHDIQKQMPALYAWARRPNARIIELGVRGGNSTSAFLAGLEHSGGEMWSVDVQHPGVPAEWAQLSWWHMLVADDLSEQAQEFCPAGVHILFIDTSHSYEHTLAELRAYAPKVRPGGVILLHDTDPVEWPGVGRALHQWCSETGNEWYDHPFWHGLGVVEIPRA